MQRRHRRRHVVIWAVLFPVLAAGLFVALAGRKPPATEPAHSLNPLLSPGE